MPKTTVTITFCLQVNGVQCSENIDIVGNIKELGSWRPDDSVSLRKSKKESDVWTCDVAIEPGTNVQYRYFVSQMLSKVCKDGTVIREKVVNRWETQLIPRSYVVGEESARDCPVEKPNRFGHYGGTYCVDYGWLTRQTEVRLRLNSDAVKIFNEKNRPSQIKITSMDVAGNDAMVASYSPTLVACLREDESQFTVQAPCGRTLSASGLLFFRTQTVDLEHLGFKAEFFEGENCVAVSHLLPFIGLVQGTKTTPINDIRNAGFFPIGELTVDFLVIHPLPHQYCDMSVSYARHWKKRGTLDVGHRGMGCSYTKLSAAKENTIGSLQSAASHGADYVEFDVQVTRDGIPIIFHDFHVVVGIKHRPGSTSDLPSLLAQEKAEPYTLAVKDLKLKQLYLLEMKHELAAADTTHSAYLLPDINCSSSDEGSLLDQPFPTLEQVFELIDDHVGFNIEIKYPMDLKESGIECKNFSDRNHYVDKILEVVLRSSGTRRILFSSFDPWTCTLVKLKQNKYPVLLLSQGQSKKYPAFKDELGNMHKYAVYYAACNKFLGVNFNSEELLSDPTPYHIAKKKELVSFVWGDELESSDTLKHFRQMGLDGVVYDRISEKIQKESVFLVEKKAKDSLLRINTPATTPTRETVQFSHFSGN